MKEFFFDNKTALPSEIIPQTLFDCDKTNNHGQYLVSNTEDVNATLYAPEVDFYLTHSEDDVETKKETLELLYEMRAIKYDLGSDETYETQVSKNLLIVSDEKTFESLRIHFEDSFDVNFCHEDDARELSGELGNFVLRSSNRLMREEMIPASQILITRDDAQKEQYVGVEKYTDEGSLESIKEKLLLRLGHYEYKKIISYNDSICQYHHRRPTESGPCTICSQLCPTLGVKHDHSLMELKFSDIDCHGCGGCVSACPSGAIDFTQFSLEAVYEIARLLEGRKIFIVPQGMISNLDVTLPQDVIPVVIEGAKFLSEAHFLTLLQESGSQIVFYTDVIAKGVKDSEKIINQIWQKRYGVEALFITMDKNELPSLFEKQQSIDGSLFKNSVTNQKSKRAKFATRLQFVVGDRELGDVETGDVVTYGEIKVDADACTLCLSCVEACNVDALQGKEETLSLQFNPSLCTNCGYCIASCAEQCMSMDKGHISLEPSWFSYQEMARDELFNCVECGEPFGTKKSVEKVANMLKGAFANDPAKLRTLYCCDKCKPKVILPNILKAQKEGISV